MRLESKKAKVYFKQKTSEITKVVAVGDVRLQKHDPSLNKTVRAQGDEATFYNLEQRVIVRGNARLWRGPDLMRGRQINYDLKTGTVTIEQVEGVVQPGKKD
jgi:lipopolysaccharide transport protein LptA